MREILMLRSLGDYGRLLLFPSDLHVERSVLNLALQDSQSWKDILTVDYLGVAGVIVIGLLLYGMFKKGVGRPPRLLGGAWFLLTYLPISNLVDLNATVAEHWLYLPSVGACIFLGGFLVELPKRYQKYVVGLALVAVAGLSARSAIRSSDWIDPETFFRRTFAAGGSNSRIGVNLGVVYAERGEDAKAEAILRKVLQISPEYQLARNNLGIALSKQGKSAEAEAMFVAAANTLSHKNAYPLTPDAATNLAKVRHAEKDDAAALSILEKARREYPSNWELVALQSQIMRESCGLACSVPVVENFVHQNWWHARASITLGALLLDTGVLPQAEEILRLASWLDVHDAQALNLLTLVNVHQNNLERALETQHHAIARQPDQPRQYIILADVLKRMGQMDEAGKAIAYANHLETSARDQFTRN